MIILKTKKYIEIMTQGTGALSNLTLSNRKQKTNLERKLLNSQKNYKLANEERNEIQNKNFYHFSKQ